MTTGQVNVRRRLAQRVAERIDLKRSLLLVAPREYCPREIGHEALRLRVGTAGFDRITLPKEAPKLAGAAERGRPVLVVADHCLDLEALAPLLGAVSDPNRMFDRLVVVVECDGCLPPHSSDYDLVLDHRDLTLPPDEVAALVPWVDDDETLHAVLRETGGVPALVAARIDTPPGADDDPLEAVVAGWADRKHRDVMSDRLLSLHVWIGRVHAESVALVAGQLQRRTITADEVRRARDAGVISSIRVAEPGMPDALARAFQALEYERAPARHRETRIGLSGAITKVTGLGALEAVRMLTALADWQVLDGVLARSLPLVAEFGPSERTTLFHQWPAEGPAGLTHLALARHVVDPQHQYDSAPGLLSSWFQLAQLFAHGDTTPGTLMTRMRDQLTVLASPGRDWALEDAGAATTQAETWLADECRRIESQGIATRSDDVALLIRMQLVVAEASIRCGEMARAQTLTARCRRLAHALEGRSRWYPALLPSVLAHTAFTAAAVGLVGVASARLTEYEDAVRNITRSTPTEDALVALTRSYIAVGRGELDPDTPLRHVDPERDFAPEEAHVHAVQVLLLHGAPAAIEWLNTMLNSTSWSESPQWAWWGLHHLLIALYARTGQLNRAQQWCERVTLPSPLNLAVRATIELAADRHAVAERLAHEVVDSGHATNRWRLLALGTRLGCFLDTGRRREADLPVSSESWDVMVDSIALFPDAVRAMVSPHLTSPRAQELPGLAVTIDSPVPDQRVVRLTPRQLEVLRELQTGDTMSTIAERLTLGTETVRSTVKEVYRRMGVHDREDAVQVGRILGLM